MGGFGLSDGIGLSFAHGPKLLVFLPNGFEASILSGQIDRLSPRHDGFARVRLLGLPASRLSLAARMSLWLILAGKNMINL
jgi:hypothetical protein